MVRARYEMNLIEGLPEKNQHLGRQVVRFGLQAAGIKTDLIADRTASAAEPLIVMTLVRHFRRAMWTIVLDLAGHGARLKYDGHSRGQKQPQDMAPPRFSLPANCG